MTEADRRMIHVEVAYARPDAQLILALDVAEGTTVAEAVERSEIASRFPELEPEQASTPPKMGIFGKVCKPAQALREGDRVEIYRPLIADPKQVRRERAAKGKTTRKGARSLNE